MKKARGGRQRLAPASGYFFILHAPFSIFWRCAVDPRDQLAMLNGLRFHYLEWGSESSPPLVLLHGYSSHAHSWDTFARAMADLFHIYVLDQRGHGETGWTDDYSADRMIEDV